MKLHSAESPRQSTQKGKALILQNTLPRVFDLVMYICIHIFTTATGYQRGLALSAIFNSPYPYLTPIKSLCHAT